MHIQVFYFNGDGSRKLLFDKLSGLRRHVDIVERCRNKIRAEKGVLSYRYKLQALGFSQYVSETEWMAEFDRSFIRGSRLETVLYIASFRSGICDGASIWTNSSTAADRSNLSSSEFTKSGSRAVLVIAYAKPKTASEKNRTKLNKLRPGFSRKSLVHLLQAYLRLTAVSLHPVNSGF